jgi:hypothetical protein
MKFNSSGQVSKLLLVLAVIILVAVVIVFLVMKMATRPQKPTGPVTPAVPLPVYEKQMGDINFIFESALDRGKILRASEIKNPRYSSSYTQDRSTGERFVQVTIGAQNKGTVNIEPNAWTIENIIDSKNREFIPIDDYTVNPWLPDPDLCGALLKPAFDPTPCTKIYEVSKESTGLKIRVETGKDNMSNNLSSGRIDSFLLDLIVK